jgi:hypothetical protein
MGTEVAVPPLILMISKPYTILAEAFASDSPSKLPGEAELDADTEGSPPNVSDAPLEAEALENVLARLVLKQASCEADRLRDGFLISFDLVRS